MPIGAVVGGAVVGAGAGIYGASKSAKAQKQAAQTAADTSLETAQLNAGLFRETRDQNLAIASPFYNNGLLAGNALTDLLLGTHSFNPAIVENPTVPGGGTFPIPASAQPPYTQAQIDAMRRNGIHGDAAAAQDALNAWMASHPGYNQGIVPGPTPTTPTGALHNAVMPNPIPVEPALTAVPYGTTAAYYGGQDRWL